VCRKIQRTTIRHEKVACRQKGRKSNRREKIKEKQHASTKEGKACTNHVVFWEHVVMRFHRGFIPILIYKYVMGWGNTSH
jgi:hypothetical protein